MPQMEFKLGRSYTRREINRVLGGNLQHYLPYLGGRILCGCFVPKLNPDAPLVVLPGRGPSIEGTAEIFAKQTEPVPVFLKQQTNAWKYVGRFTVQRRVMDKRVIRSQERRTGRKLSQVLRLRASKQALR